MQDELIMQYVMAILDRDFGILLHTMIPQLDIATLFDGDLLNNERVVKLERDSKISDSIELKAFHYGYMSW